MAKILIVDDNEDLREFFQYYLKNMDMKRGRQFPAMK